MPGKETVLGFAELWDALLPLGRDAATGGYRRYSFTKADMACREWFASAAAQRGMRASTDRNGNLWAWWDVPGGLGGQAAGPGSPSAAPGAATSTTVTRVPGQSRSAVATRRHGPAPMTRGLPRGMVLQASNEYPSGKSCRARPAYGERQHA